MPEESSRDRQSVTPLDQIRYKSSFGREIRFDLSRFMGIIRSAIPYNLPGETLGELKPGKEKEKKWKSTVREIRRIEREDGYPIDENVRELVIALNALDIPTMLSCEGHVYEDEKKYGRQAPWVWIGKSHITILEDPDLKTQNAAKNLADYHRLNSYLQEFYQNRTVSPQAQLVLELDRKGTPFDELNTSHLHNRGQMEFQLTGAERSVKLHELEELQKEIRDFGVFLKSKFLES